MAVRARPPISPALHLHLDVAGGVRADALLGALVAAGAPAHAANEALVALFGPGARLTAERTRVHGLTAIRASLALPGALAEGSASVPTVVRVAGAERRRRTRTWARDARKEVVLAPTAEAAAPAPTDDGPRPMARARRQRAAAVPSLLTRWEAGEAARPADLVVVLRASDLAPVEKALALRTATTLVEALGRVRGSVDAPVLAGPFCVAAVARMAAAGALVAALSPSVITASVLGLPARAALAEGLLDDPGLVPSPWLLAVLEGAWLLEGEEDLPPSDIVGAALVRTLASRFGARGLFSVLKQGAGVAAVGDAPAPLLVRAVTGRAAPVASRSGEARGSPCLLVRAQVPLGASRDALASALFAAGALETSAREVHDLGSRATLLVESVVPARGVDDAVGALWRAGAEHTTVAWVEGRSPGLEEVTVPVGQGRTKASVRVRVVRDDGGSLLSIQSVADDVREAARASRRPEEEVRAEALQTWRSWLEQSEQDEQNEQDEPSEQDEQSEQDEPSDKR